MSKYDMNKTELQLARKVSNAWQNSLADHGFVNPTGVIVKGTRIEVTVYQWNPPMVRGTEIECRMRKSISDGAREKYHAPAAGKENFTDEIVPRPGA